GANEATTIQFSTDVKVNGAIVPKGKYALFTIPAENEWTIILNKKWDQWGLDYDKNQSEDLLHFKVTPEKGSYTERLLFYFSNTARSKASLNLAWEKINISFEIESYLTNDDDKTVRLSPVASVYQRVGITDFTLTFGSPAVKNRIIWGNLIPFNRVWRAGADEATTISFSTDVIINNKKIPAGKYALFIVVGKSDWVIILNKKWDQWGLDYNNNKRYNFASFKIKPEKDAFNERLFYNFSDMSDNSVTISLLWETVKASFKIGIDLESQVQKRIVNLLERAKSNDWKIYMDAAEYGIENNFFKEAPLKWIDKSLAINETYKGYFLKATYYYKNKKYLEALQQLDKCRDKGQSERDYRNFVSQVDNLERRIRENNK
ncbi:MAG: hypothetical protein C0412_06125, partial [Flavobacterium sp.]|nr:hypothetical protein [Flavobacterium sp.]